MFEVLICRNGLYQFQQKHKSGQNNQKRKVKGRKHSDVVSALSGIMLDIFSESNKTCKGRNKRSDTSDIYSYQ